MLSGAHDILKRLDPSLGTGAVLLADILPTVLIKTTGQLFLFQFSYTTRVLACIAAALASFLLVNGSVLQLTSNCFLKSSPF